MYGKIYFKDSDISIKNNLLHLGKVRFAGKGTFKQILKGSI